LQKNAKILLTDGILSQFLNTLT